MQPNDKERGEVIEDFLANFFQHTQGPVYISTFPNEKDAPGQANEKHVMTRDAATVQSFVKKWDREGRGMFFGVATLKDGAHRRGKETVRDLIGLWVDVDFKGLDTSDVGERLVGTVLIAINQLPCPPTLVVHSGRGLHAYWLLHEPLELADAPELVERVEQALRQLADLTGGDLAVCEVSRVMRLPGTHNTKGGEFIPVRVTQSNWMRRYELSDLEDMVSICSPVLRRKPMVKREGAIEVAENPFLAAARSLGYKPPVDVEERLSRMSYQGSGDSSIHSTQLSVTAALLSRGATVEEAVSTVLSATQGAAGEYGTRWNWRREERSLRQMCETWMRKNPQAMREKDDDDRAGKMASVGGDAGERGEGGAGGPADGGASVEQDTAGVDGEGDGRERRAPDASGKGGPVLRLVTTNENRVKPPKAAKDDGDKADPAEIVAQGVVGLYVAQDKRLMASGGILWVYQAGVWRQESDDERHEINVAIQQGLKTLGVSPKTGLVAQINQMIRNDPKLFVKSPPWNDTLLVCQNVALRLSGMREALPETVALAPELYARSCIAPAYDPEADCPETIAYLHQLFENRGEDRQAFVDVVQEIFGAALATGLLPREARRATFVHGPSSTGKSRISGLLRRLLMGRGARVASPKLDALEGRFGMAEFLGASAWICDDAAREGGGFDPSQFKVIVTGEDVSIERKNMPAVSTSLAIPVMLTMNNLPRVRDDSDAVYRRTIVLEVTRVWSDEEAAAWRLERGNTTQPIDAWLFEREASGLLNWALVGLQRLLDRGGRFDLPPAMIVAVQQFQHENSRIREWATEAVRVNPERKVARADVMRALHGWQMETDGGEAKAFGGRGLWPRLRAMFPQIDPDYRSNGVRYVAGLELTDEGLAQWDRHCEGSNLRGGSTGHATNSGTVNGYLETKATRFPK